MKFNPEHDYTFGNVTLTTDGDRYRLMYYYRNFIFVTPGGDSVAFIPIEKGDLDPVFANEKNDIFENTLPSDIKTQLDNMIEGHENDYKKDGVVYKGESK